MAIDTHAYVKELETAGVDRATAEAHVKALTDHALPDVATKADLNLLEARLTAQLTIRFGSMIAVATAVLACCRVLRMTPIRPRFRPDAPCPAGRGGLGYSPAVRSVDEWVPACAGTF